MTLVIRIAAHGRDPLAVDQYEAVGEADLIAMRLDRCDLRVPLNRTRSICWERNMRPYREMGAPMLEDHSLVLGGGGVAGTRVPAAEAGRAGLADAG
jgi:hypothetical protein